jgi:predicted Zn-dependent protease
MTSGVAHVFEMKVQRILSPIYVVLLVSGAVALTNGGCAVNPVSGMPEVTLVSTEQEKQIGAEEAKKVAMQMGLLDDGALTPYLNQLGQRLAEQSPRKDVTYQFHLVDMTEPNAFALPGGYVYVTRGLLVLTNSEDELAGVVGHEIGHVAARHSVQKISKQGPFAMVFGIVSGITGLVSPLVGNIVGGIGDFAQSLVFAPYSRSQETEADKIGQEMAAKAGWDPAALSSFLNTLGREVDLMSKEPRKPSFFDSHPATPDRVEKTAAHAKELTRVNRAPISPTREAYLARLDGLVVGQRAANGIVEKHAILHPDFNFFAQFPEKWQIENSPKKIVAVAPDGDAAVVLGASAEGNDPLDGARAVEKATKSSDIVSKTEPLTVNGLSAAHTQIEADSGVTLDLTWIAHEGVIYQVVGIAPTKQFKSMQAIFHSVAHSFRPLSASERANITEKRVRLVKARAGETLEALGTRTNSAWKKEEIAVANALQAGTPLQEGQLLKVAIAERYIPKAQHK